MTKGICVKLTEANNMDILNLNLSLPTPSICDQTSI